MPLGTQNSAKAEAIQSLLGFFLVHGMDVEVAA
jgi:hypothetical protein